MKRQGLPRANISVRSDMRTALSPQALDRWAPGVRAAGDAANEIAIFDVIGVDFWTGDGVTAKRVAAQLKAIGDAAVTVNINSPGGDFFEGLAIYNLLREHPGDVSVNVLGMAASAASVIAMAGDTVRIARAGFLMIHNTWVIAAGDQHALREVADWLIPFDQASAELYAARSGQKVADVQAMLDRETWLKGEEAVAKGFADDLLASDAVDSVSVDAAARSTPAAHKLNEILAKAGVPRSERRQLIMALKGDTQNAVAAGTQNAADLEARVEGLLRQVKSL